MSDQEIEELVQSNAQLVKEYLIEQASREMKAPIKFLEIVGSTTDQKIGVSGQVYISDIHYETELGPGSTSIAIKYYMNAENILTEIRNSMELEIRFKSAPELGVPRILFASTDPAVVIYEGISGTNYDETSLENKAIYAAKLLAKVHMAQVKPVNYDLYLNLFRKLAEYYAVTGYERKITQAVRIYLERVKGARSGCNPHSDFHQSNVMLNIIDDQVAKTYLLDPEFMEKGDFDRMEDIGVFFGNQLLQEFLTTNKVAQGIKDVKIFLRTYEKQIVENKGLPLKDMYPNGNPLGFFIALWTLMDTINTALAEGDEQLQSPDVLRRIQFVLHLLKMDLFAFP